MGVVVTVLASVLVVLPVATSVAGAAGTTVRVSTTSTNGEAPGASRGAATSVDGRYVAFVSDAALVSADTNGLSDVYRKDTTTGAVVLVSVAAGSNAAGDDASDTPYVAISDDGDRVVFSSQATNLVDGDANARRDLFVRDITDGTTVFANSDNGETTTGTRPSHFSVSADGNRIAFLSATSLDGSPAGPAVFVRDVDAGTTTFINVADVAPVAISGDGTKTAFSWSGPSATEIYLHDVNDPVLYRINYGTSSGFADPAALLGPDAMSFDGNITAFWSDGDTYDNVPSTADPRAVYAYDHAARKAGGFGMERISELPDGTDGDGDSAPGTVEPRGAVSADGMKVAFTSMAVNLGAGASPNGAVMVKDRTADTIEARSTSATGGARPAGDAGLSADGSTVVFSSDDAGLVAGDGNGVSDVFINAEGATVPAPEVIVFDSNRFGNFDIFSMAPDGTNVQHLIRDTLGDTDPAVSPDGTRLAWVSDRSGNLDIWVADIDGSNPVNVTASPGPDADPAWSPDGSLLAFASFRTGDYDVWIQEPVAGATARNITNDPTRVYDGFPSFSPDGSQIVFRSAVVSAPDIVRIGLDGTGRTVLATGDGVANDRPDWSPDGTRIAFSSDRDGNNEIYVMDATDGANQTRVTNNANADFAPSWSPDSSRIVFERYFFEGVSTIESIGADGTAPLTLTDIAADSRSPEWGGRAVAAETTFTLTADATTPVTPAVVPLADVPLQPGSPASAGVGLQGLSFAPVGLQGLSFAPVGLQGLSFAPVGLQGLSFAPVGLQGLSFAPVGLQGLSFAPVGLQGLSFAPAAVEGLRSTSLADVPLKDPKTWETVLGAALAGRPLQTVTLYDVYSMNPLPLAVQQLTLADFQWSGPLGELAPGTLLLGRTPLSAFTAPAGVDWCQRLEINGFANCGASVSREQGLAGTSASPLELQLGGVPFDGTGDHSIPLQAVRMGATTLHDSAPLLGIPLAEFNLEYGRIGSLTVGRILQTTADPNRDIAENPVFRCEVIACDPASTMTLFDAAELDAVKVPGRDGEHGARFVDVYRGLTGPAQAAASDLLLGEVVNALLPISQNPFGQIPLRQLGIADHDGPDSSLVTLTATAVLGAAAASRVSFDLPESFVVEPGGATFSIDGGESTLIDPTPSDLGLVFDLPTTAAGQQVELRVAARPAFEFGGFSATAKLHVPALAVEIERATRFDVTERHEPTDDDNVEARSIVPDHLYLGHIGRSGDQDIVKLAVQKNDRVSLFVDHLPIDVDAVVYQPNGAPSMRPLRAAAEGNDTNTILPVLDEGVGLAGLGEPITPDTRQDLPLLDLPIAGLSANRGTTAERVDVLATATGDLVIQLLGYNGGFSRESFSYRVTVTPTSEPECAARQYRYAESVTGRLPASVPTETRTLVLVDRGAMADLYGSDAAARLAAKIAELGTDDRVAGHVRPVVLEVDGAAAVRTARSTWDVNPCSADLANAYVRAVNDVVDSYLTPEHTALENIVLIGNDDAMPMARIPDLTQTANELGFANELAAEHPGSTVRAAAAGGFVLSDNPYGTLQPQPWLDRDLYVPDLAIGRLVERIDEEIIPYIDRFIASSATLDVSTALTTGYDFFGDLAADQDAVADGRFVGADGAPSDQPSLLGAWTENNLLAGLDADPGLASVNAHFHPQAALPGGATDVDGDGRIDLLTPKDVATRAGIDLGGKLVTSIGCHSATQLPDVTAGALDPEEARYFTQAFIREGATFAGQTGYGLGLHQTIALSEQILADYTRNLAAGLSPGRAMSEAKQSYLGGLGVYGVYDEKVLAEATVFGLPMYRMPGAADAVAASAAAADGGALGPASIDPVTGIERRALDVTPALTPRVTDDGRYLAGDDGVQVTHHRPIVPKVVVPVSAGTRAATGLLPTGFVTHDESGVDPVFARPAVATAAQEPEVASLGTIFPAAQTNLSTYLSSDGPQQNAVFLASQFEATGVVGEEVVGTERRLRSISSEVLYGTGDGAAATITRADAVITGDRVSFAIDADGASSVSVLFKDETAPDAAGDVAWKRVLLTNTGGTRWTASAPVVGDSLEYQAFAVSPGGHVSVHANKGENNAATVAPAAPADIAVTITGTPADAPSGWYESATVTLSGPSGTTFRVAVDGAPETAYTGPLSFDTDGVHRIDYVADLGGGEQVSGVAYVNIDASAPTALITLSPAEGPYGVDEVVTAHFTCLDAGSGVESCTASGAKGPITNGGTVDTGIDILGGDQSADRVVTVVATDRLGQTSTTARTYQVRYDFGGFLAPVEMDRLNAATAGQTIPVKWQLRRADGSFERSLSVVRAGGITSKTIDCPKDPAVQVIVITLPLNLLHYDLLNEQYVYGWKTEKSFAKSCRSFEVKLIDGTHAKAIFQFK